jgi:hypothetical protein
MNAYNVGDQIRLEASFTNIAGTPTDPTTVTCIVKRRYQLPPVASTTYTYPATITKTGTGEYYVDVTPDNEGIWDYRWVATGTIVAAEESAFNVPNSEFF